MNEILEAVILGIVQGVVDPMPVSSSGHLVLMQHLFGIQERLTLSIFLHFGTFIAIGLAFRKDIAEIFQARKDPGCRRFTLYILLGIIPAGLLGFGFKAFYEQAFRSTSLVGYMLLVTGTLLWASDRVTKKGRVMGQMRLSDSLIVGLAQASALFPGLSRSGTTITGGLFKGLDRELAVKYSFLMSIPVVLGATLLETHDVYLNGLGEVTLAQIIVGTLTAVISGYVAIKLLMELVKRKKLSFFAVYCWILGLMVIILT